MITEAQMETILNNSRGEKALEKCRLYRMQVEDFNLIIEYSKNCFFAFKSMEPDHTNPSIKRDYGIVDGHKGIDFVKALIDLLRELGFRVKWSLPNPLSIYADEYELLMEVDV